MVGFKQTDIGPIPEDWEVKRLIYCLVENPKYGIGAAAIDKNSNFPTYLRITDIQDDGTINQKELKSVNHPESQNYYLSDGDIVFARTGASVGKSYLHKEKNGEFVYAGFLIKVNPSKNKLIPYFLKSYVSTQSYWDWVDVMSMRSGQPGINANEFGQLQIPLPNLKEQEAISEVLSDTDAIITTLEKRIAKKHNIKQGAMQKLLSPKDDWEVKKLVNLVSTPITDGPHLTPEFVKNGIPFLSVNNLVDNKIDFTDLRQISIKDHEFFSRKCKPEKNDILLGKAASVGKIAVVETDFEFNIWSPIAMIRLKKNISSMFVYYSFQSRPLLNQINYFTNASSQGNIGMGDIEKLKITLPPSDEQTCIATILSDMDREIDALEKKLSKTKNLKQGLMQQLLTGKIRLV